MSKPCTRPFREHSGKLCVRRILGTVGFVSCIVAVFARIQHPLLEELLIVSAGLVGLTTFDVFSGQAGHKRERNSEGGSLSGIGG